MARTLTALINEAYSRSAAARPDVFATDAGDLMARANLAQQEMFFLAAAKNPYIIARFADTALQVAGGGLPAGWPRPSDALSIFRCEATGATVANPALATGATISLVPFNDRLVQEGEPSLYEFGGLFVPSGQSLDPSAGIVRIFYCRQPIAFTSVNSTSDAAIPDPYLQVIVADLALFLAIKEQRAEDIAAFSGEKGTQLAAWDNWLRNATQGFVQRFRTISPPIISDEG